tara:strand:+ start:11740 stop:11982 length:243 start_codon:yes stop_codon:yes gene_type:complete
MVIKIMDSNKRKSDVDACTNNNRKKRMDMSPEVKEAVDDILNGVTVNSSTEWVQREYLRLMRREANKRQNESILKTQNSK